MYKNIYIPVDNSAFSNTGIDVGILFSKKFSAKYTGSHVYAATLHDTRFKQMEGGLPDKYKVEEELFKQREVHDTLIDKGLKVISDSFLDVFESRCKKSNIPYNRRVLEGKNFQLLVNDISENSYDLVIIGVLGLGAVKASVIGSVCERVVRRVKTDVLVIKKTEIVESGKKIVVGIDGSPESFSGLKKAIGLAKEFNLEVDAVSAFDPYYHYVAFNSIVDVLSKEAADVFKFEEQEKLHEEIIDSGLAQIYQANLDIAKKVAASENFEIKTVLLDGKPFEKIYQYVKKVDPWLLVLGRKGIHCDEDMDIGSNTENLLRISPCNLLIANGQFKPKFEMNEIEASMPWTVESEERLKRIPSFAVKMAKKAIYKYAVDNGYTIITSDVIGQVMSKFMPGASAKPGDSRNANGNLEEKNEFRWLDSGLARIKDASSSESLLPLQKLRVEKFAKASGVFEIDEAVVDKALGDLNSDSDNSETAH